MAKLDNIVIEFQVESADRSVGIMAEGFSAWERGGSSYCNLSDYGVTFETAKFSWFRNEEQDECIPPPNAKFVERALHSFVLSYHSFVLSYYESEELLHR
jgi:hypothetical protein